MSQQQDISRKKYKIYQCFWVGTIRKMQLNAIHRFYNMQETSTEYADFFHSKHNNKNYLFHSSVINIK